MKWKSVSRVRLFVTPKDYTVHGILQATPGVGSCSLLQGIFPTQGSNPGLPHCRRILYHWAAREAWGLCRTGEKRRPKAASFWEIPGPGIPGVLHLSVPQWALPSGSKIMMPSCFPSYDLKAGLSLVSLVAECKEPACQCRRCRFDPWVGRSPGGRNGNPFQYSCLENPTDRGAWWATVHGVANELVTKQQQQ